MSKKKKKNKTSSVFTAAKYISNFIFNSSSMSAETSTLRSKDDKPAPTPKPPVLYYEEKAFRTIQYLVEKCTKEVGWLGLVEPLGDDYLITKIYVPKQTVTGTETDIEAEDMADLALQIITAGDDPSELRYWGHSHVHMGVRPSAQDEEQVDEYLADCDYFIRGIYNKRGDSKVDFYDKTNKVVHQCIDEEILGEELSTQERAALDALIKANVVEPIYRAPTLPAANLGHNTYYFPQSQGTNIPQQTQLDEPVDDTWLDDDLSIINEMAAGAEEINPTSLTQEEREVLLIAGMSVQEAVHLGLTQWDLDTMIRMEEEEIEDYIVMIRSTTTAAGNA
ncbi:MAG: hypothetical protein ACRBBW_16255 [Cellvibrionaceae bacterium]